MLWYMYIPGVLVIVLMLWGALSDHIPFFYNRIPKNAKKEVKPSLDKFHLLFG